MVDLDMKWYSGGLLYARENKNLIGQNDDTSLTGIHFLPTFSPLEFFHLIMWLRTARHACIKPLSNKKIELPWIILTRDREAWDRNREPLFCINCESLSLWLISKISGLLSDQFVIYAASNKFWLSCSYNNLKYDM